MFTEYSLSKKPLAIEKAISKCIRSEVHSKSVFRDWLATTQVKLRTTNKFFF
jgi:hypothetical protein